MISSGELTASQIAEAAGCNKRAITRIRSNMRLFGSIRAPSIKAGRPRSITPIMLEALCDRLLEKPGLYLHEMEILLLDEFDVSIPKSTISNTLHRKGWSKKTARLVYLPPYSPDLNPIEEFFAELKAFIRWHWQSYEENPDQGFDNFLERCVDKVGAKEQSARGHFRNVGLDIEEL